VEVDYSGFRHAYGGDYGSRLTVVRLPDLAAVPARNDARTATVTAELTDGLYAVAAAPSGSAGSFQPTSLAPSATWQVGLQSGDFTWSYPVAMPPMPGPVPEVTLSYSSGAVDGRVASTNNQASWVGEGFDFQPGFIERSYQVCGKDGQVGSEDLCWVSDNATVMLPGLTSELVRDDTTGTWRAERDSGWRVERLTGASNGDDNGEYWRLTAPAGTQYFFGRHRLPEWQAGNPETNSTWTVPVFGNQTGEPCHAATFAASSCQQAYRWNLDFVIDRHNDVNSYFYERETNFYAQNRATGTSYVRGGYPTRIDYGQRVGTVYTAAAPGRVVFTTADRCLAGSACVQSQPQDWPDVPWDEWCAGASCPVPSPTFWSTKRLAQITTQTFTGLAYQDVDSWALAHEYPVPEGDTTATPSLWLNSIVHIGRSGGNALTLPAVSFDGAVLANRVDAPDQWEAMYKRRLRQIYTESGGQISVSYDNQQCSRAALPQPDANQARCFPVFWGTNTTEDWFAKYVVTEVTETDRVGGNAAKVTSYEYVMNGAGWHHDDAELVPDARKSWGQFRGFQLVRVRTGGAGVPKTLTENVFLRGMNGDVNKTGAPDAVTVDGVVDKPAWRGFTRMATVYDGDGGPQVSTTTSEPAQIGVATARRLRGSSGWLEAYVTDVAWRREVTALAGGATRTNEVSYTYDPNFGTVSQISDKGDLATPADDTCTDITYARNLTDWLVNTVARELTSGVACGTTPSYPADLVADRRTSYDGLAWNAAPTAGDVTRVEEAGSYTTTPVYVTTRRSVVDGHGRTVQRFDASGQLTTTAYTPALGGPLTRTVVTDAKGFATTTNSDARGNTTSTVDANGGTTTMAYDGLGRLVRVWLPGRATTQTPNTEYVYVVRDDGPSVVTTRRLITGSTVVVSYELFDGLLRSRQTQQSAPGGGRIVTDTVYDSHGWVDVKTSPRTDPGSPGTALLALPAPTGVVAETSYGYDGTGRTTAEIFLANGVEKWRTRTSYGGNSTSVDPPEGGTATTTLVDARGRTVELRQYHGGAPTGDYDATRYTYTKAGDLATVTDPAGNSWQYTYDLRRRRITTQAPDTAATTFTYDDEGRLLSTTDGRGLTLAYTYDELDRKTGLYAGSTSGAKLAEWTYDTATGGKGRPAASTRFSGGNAYTDAVTAYDGRGRETARTVTIPAAEGALAGSYTTMTAYNEADQVATAVQPAGGGLAAENLSYGYDSLGRLATLRSAAATYVAATSYTSLGEADVYTFGAPGAQLTRDLSYEDDTRRLSGVVTAAGATELSRTAYSYDPAGSVVRAADLTVGDIQCFRHDHLRRLVDAWTPGAGDCQATPGTAALGGPAPYWHSYTYDVVGNRRTEVRHATGGDLVRTYGYPAAGAAQPHTLRTVAASGPGAGPAESYAYDAAGNTTGRTIGTAAQSLTWDAEGRLATATAAGASTSFVYDADGDRLLRRDPTATTLYLGDTELRLSAGVVAGTRYYRFGDTVVAVRSGGGLTWLASDQDGTTGLAVAATTGTLTRRYDLPFGGPRGAQPALWPGERGFVGGTIDDSTGMVHLGAREYDSVTGRFVSVDPVVDPEDPQQLEGYAYANNSPITFSDPDGRLVKVVDSVSMSLVTDSVSMSSSRSLGVLVIEPIYVYGDQLDDAGCVCGTYKPFPQTQPPFGSLVVSGPPSMKPCGGWSQCLPWRPGESGNNAILSTMSTMSSQSTAPQTQSTSPSYARPAWWPWYHKAPWSRPGPGRHSHDVCAQVSPSPCGSGHWSHHRYHHTWWHYPRWHRPDPPVTPASRRW
jgi:RHS repeat-associated protein